MAAERPPTRLLWAGALGLLAAGCSALRGGGDPMQLYDQVRAHCADKPLPCEVSLPELTSFDWDRVAFVGMHATGRKVGEALGTGPLPKPEFQDQIVFVKDGAVVHREHRDYHPEQPYRHTVFLDAGQGHTEWRIYSREDAVFLVQSDVDSAPNITLSPRS